MKIFQSRWFWITIIVVIIFIMVWYYMFYRNKIHSISYNKSNGNLKFKVGNKSIEWVPSGGDIRRGYHTPVALEGAGGRIFEIDTGLDKDTLGLKPNQVMITLLSPRNKKGDRRILNTALFEYDKETFDKIKEARK